LQAVDEALNEFQQSSSLHHSHVPSTDLLQIEGSPIEMRCLLDCPLFWRAVAYRQNALLLQQAIESAPKALNLSAL
jgi:hypothetical protein